MLSHVYWRLTVTLKVDCDHWAGVGRHGLWVRIREMTGVDLSYNMAEVRIRRPYLSFPGVALLACTTIHARAALQSLRSGGRQ